MGADRAGCRLGMGDDAALLRVPDGTDLVAAVDTIVAGRHFPAGSRCPLDRASRARRESERPGGHGRDARVGDAGADAAGRRSRVARAASRAGFCELAAAHGVALVGGDTTAGPLTVSVQIMGHVPRGSALRRSGAQAGRSPGGDRHARRCRRRPRARDRARSRRRTRPPARELLRRFEYPTPRVEFGLAARGIATRGDGSVRRTGGRSAEARGRERARAPHVDVERLPLSRALRGSGPAEQARDWALGGGRRLRAAARGAAGALRRTRRPRGAIELND